jgi:hypothetical protein
MVDHLRFDPQAELKLLSENGTLAEAGPAK